MTDTARPPAKAAGAPLWRMDGARYGRSDAWASALGGLRITHHDMGAADYAAWGEDDNEQSLELTPAAAAKLAITSFAIGSRGDPTPLKRSAPIVTNRMWIRPCADGLRSVAQPTPRRP